MIGQRRFVIRRARTNHGGVRARFLDQSGQRFERLPLEDVVDAHFARWEGLKPGEKKAAVAQSVPIGRFAQPEDIAGLAVFLASSDSDYILAQTYNVDGGNWMS